MFKQFLDENGNDSLRFVLNLFFREVLLHPLTDFFEGKLTFFGSFRRFTKPFNSYFNPLYQYLMSSVSCGDMSMKIMYLKRTNIVCNVSFLLSIVFLVVLSWCNFKHFIVYF